MANCENIPQELKALPNFVTHRNKIPYTPGTGQRAKSNDPQTWRSYDETVKALQGNTTYQGIGFMFSGSGFVGVDLDHCIGPDGKLTDTAADIVEMLDSYTEISTSGDGLHIIMRGHVPGERNRKAGFEIYDKGRYFVMTGNVFRGAPIRSDQVRIDQFYHKYIDTEPDLLASAPDPGQEPRDPGPKTQQPARRNIEIDKLLNVIRRSKSGELFIKLFDRGDFSGYKSQSEADQALMNLLPFYTRGNPEQMRYIFSLSALAGRKKGRSKYYQDRTINKALKSWDGTIYDPETYARRKVIDSLASDEPELQAAEVLDPAEWQPEDFKDGKKLRAIFNCIYANDDDDLLEALKNRASDLKISRISQRWVKYRDERKKQESAAMVAEKVNGLRILPEAAGLKTGPYHITTSGIIKEVEKKEEVVIINIISVPVLPVGILTNIETGYVKTRLWWKPGNGKAREEIFENRTLADKSKILMLADRGLPVDSLNARDLVEYLSVIKAKNSDVIPQEDSVSSLGWHNNNETFAPYDQEQIIDNITENNTIYRSIKSKGTFQEWADFMAQRLTDKRLHIVMAASFGSVILRLVGALPFILHFWGKTGTGKTVALMAAASVWGNPEAGAYLRSMDATTNAVMKLAGFLRNLPVVADEMQTVRDREGDYDKFIMRVTEGIERGRLNADSSLKPLQEWSTIFITSGEEPIVNVKSGAGAVNRVIEVELEPDAPLFPGEMGNEVANFCREHYGTAGPELIRQIKKLGPELLIEAYKNCSKTLMQNNITAKQAFSAAAILTGSRLMCNLVFKGKLEPLQPNDILPYLKTELTVDPAERAYSTLINLFAANRNRFESKRDTGTMIYEYEPGQGETWGKVFDGGYFVNKSILERELQNIGFQFDAVKKAWAGKGYLIKDSQGKYSHQRTEAGVYCNYIYMVSKPTET